MRTCPACQHDYEDAVQRCPADGVDLAHADPLVGRVVGSYRLQRLLGEGGMGAVYEAVHPVIGSRVAIKLLHPRYAFHKELVDRFHNEARAVNLIGHENILKILDLDVTEDQRHYCVMELLLGKSLQALLAPGKPLPLAVSGPILVQICEALQAAHDRQILHRDLKPDNVFLTTLHGRKHFVKVVDFGIAKLGDPTSIARLKTQTGVVLGTPAYMSPEQGAGEARIDGRADIYSLGVMMFQMATGRRPFSGASFGELLMCHMQKPPPRPRALNPAVPGALEAIVLKALAKKPDDRQGSMRELRDALLEAMRAQGVSRELPVADEPVEQEAAPVDPRGRTPVRAADTDPLHGKTPVQGLAAPTLRLPDRRGSGVLATELAAARPPAPRKRRALLLALAASGLIAAGVLAVALLAAAPIVEPAPRKRAAPAAAASEPQPTTVVLSIASDPPGAQASYAVNGEERRSATPFDLALPAAAAVHFVFEKAGYAAASVDAVADRARRVEVRLVPLPSRAPPGNKGVRRARATRKEGKPKESRPSRDGLMKLDDEL